MNFSNPSLHIGNGLLASQAFDVLGGLFLSLIGAAIFYTLATWRFSALQVDDPANPLTLAFRIGIDGIKPLTPEQAEFCAALLKTTGAAPATPPWESAATNRRARIGTRCS